MRDAGMSWRCLQLAAGPGRGGGFIRSRRRESSTVRSVLAFRCAGLTTRGRRQMQGCVLLHPVLAFFCAAGLVCSVHAADQPGPVAKIEVKVLVLNFDPSIPAEGNRPLSEVCRFQNPRKLATDYVADMQQ